MLTQERLKELISYDPVDGTFCWKVTRSNRAVAGKVAGKCKDSKGYSVIRVDKRLYRAHRLAYLYITGEWPESDVDHKNNNRADNRWENLRASTRSQNIANKATPASNKSGVKGVCWNVAHQRWLVTLRVEGRHKYIGEFRCKKTAVRAVREARQRFHGEFARHD